MRLFILIILLSLANTQVFSQDKSYLDLDSISVCDLKPFIGNTFEYLLSRIDTTSQYNLYDFDSENNRIAENFKGAKFKFCRKFDVNSCYMFYVEYFEKINISKPISYNDVKLFHKCKIKSLVFNEINRNFTITDGSAYEKDSFHLSALKAKNLLPNLINLEDISICDIKKLYGKSISFLISHLDTIKQYKMWRFYAGESETCDEYIMAELRFCSNGKNDFLFDIVFEEPIPISLSNGNSDINAFLNCRIKKLGFHSNKIRIILSEHQIFERER